MPHIIELPDGTRAEFPDDATQEEMQSVLDEQFPVESKPKTSFSGTLAREAALGVIPSLGAAVGGDIGMTLLAPTAPATAGIGPLVGGFAGAMAGSVGADWLQRKVTEAIVPETARQVEELRQTGMQEHPAAAFIGRLAAPGAVFKVAPGLTVKGIAAIPNILRGTSTAAEKAAAKVAAVQTGLGTAGGAVMPLVQGQAPTPEGLAEAALQSVLYGPTRFNARSLPLAQAEVRRVADEIEGRAPQLQADQLALESEPLKQPVDPLDRSQWATEADIILPPSATKGAPNAVQVESANAPDVLPAPAGSQAVGEGVRSPEELARAQAGEAAAAAQGEVALTPEGKPTIDTAIEQGKQGKASPLPPDDLAAPQAEVKPTGKTSVDVKLPQAMYFHGSSEALSKSLKVGLGENPNRYLHEEGIWFAPLEGKDFESATISEAIWYSGDEGTIVKAKLSLKNPYYGDVDNIVSDKINARWLREHGYDGFIDNSSGSGMVVVLDPAQVKEVKRTDLSKRKPARIKEETFQELIKKHGFQKANQIMLGRQVYEKPTSPQAELAKATGEVDKQPRRIVSVATRLGNVVETGSIHPEAEAKLRSTLKLKFDDPKLEDMEHGFLDNEGKFLSREEAFQIAKQAGQLKDLEDPRVFWLDKANLVTEPERQSKTALPKATGVETPAPASSEAKPVAPKAAVAEAQKQVSNESQETGISNRQTGVGTPETGTQSSNPSTPTDAGRVRASGERISQETGRRRTVEDVPPWKLKREQWIFDRPIPAEEGWRVKVSYLDNPSGPNRGTEDLWQSNKPQKGDAEIGTWGRYIVQSVSRERPTRKQSESLIHDERYREHRIAVEQAIKEGKSVPPEVLADYPELKPTPPAAKPGEGPGAQQPIRNPEDIPPSALGISPAAATARTAKLFAKDLKDFAVKAADGLRETGQQIRELLAPGAYSQSGRQARGIVREQNASLARKDKQVSEQFNRARKLFDSLSETDSLDFIDRMESGRAQPSPELQSIADALRIRFDQRAAAVQALGTGKLQHLVQDYFPHIWKDVRAAQTWYARLFGKRPLRGPGSFLKHRTVPTTMDGINAGLVPVDYNPINLTLLKIHEMDRYIMGQKIFQELKDQGLAKFSRAGHAPAGMAPINDPIAQVVQYRPTVTASGAPGAMERILRGQWYANEDAARVLNNFLSPGLSRYAWFRGMRSIGNTLNMAQLGFSGYHGLFTMIDAGTSKLSLGIEQLGQFNRKGIGTSVRGLVGTVSANQAEAFYKGSKVLKEYSRPGSVGGDYARVVDALVAAGGRVEMPRIFKNDSLENFFKAVRQGNYVGGLFRAPFAAIEGVSYPLMQVVVPRLKLGVFNDMALHEMERMGPGVSREEFRQSMGKIWDSVDNRLGELVYDNLFWNKTLKDLSFLMVRAVGWNLGTIREIGGGMLDSTTAISRLRSGDPVITKRMAYTAALPFTVGLMGALYQYMHTGQGPQELRDYFYPKTGKILPDGTVERVHFPSYLKDLASYKRHPFTTLGHKLHPMWGSLIDMMNNKDFYGTQIRNPDDPLVQQLGQVAKYVAGSYVPFSVKGAQRRVGAEESKAIQAESFFGIMPISPEIARSNAQNKIMEYSLKSLPKGARTPEEQERHEFVREIQDSMMGSEDYRAAREALLKAEREGKLTRGQRIYQQNKARFINNEIRRGHTKSQAQWLWRYNHLNLDEAQHVYEIALPEEKQLFDRSLKLKIRKGPRATNP